MACRRAPLPQYALERDRTYGDVNLQGEQEHSKYYFEVADVERLRQMYNLFEAEAEACAGKTAWCCRRTIMCSSARTPSTCSIRAARWASPSARRCLAACATFRAGWRSVCRAAPALEFPWLKGAANRAPESRAAGAGTAAPAADVPAASPGPSCWKLARKNCPPPTWIPPWQLRERVPALLDELRLEHGEVRVSRHAAPAGGFGRRPGSRQPDRTTVVKGPPANRAFDASGAADQGRRRLCPRARDRGQRPAGARDGWRQYVVAEVHEPGRPAPEVLAEALPGLSPACALIKPCAGTAAGWPSRAPSAGCWRCWASRWSRSAMPGCSRARDARAALSSEVRVHLPIPAPGRIF
jgi:glycyl-tRNA synthetase